MARPPGDPLVKRSISLLAWMLVVLSVGFAAPAPAATLELRLVSTAQQIGGPGSRYYAVPFEPIVFELWATIGNPEPVNSLALDVRLLSGGTVSWIGATQVGLTSTVAPGATLPWTVFPPLCSGGDPCVALNQVNPVLPSGFPADPFSSVIATITAFPTSFSFGQVSVDVQDFFGAAPPAGASWFVSEFVPEPGTAALVAFGLVGLGWRGRRGKECT